MRSPQRRIGEAGQTPRGFDAIKVKKLSIGLAAGDLEGEAVHADVEALLSVQFFP
jgi:hypothetical protein